MIKVHRVRISELQRINRRAAYFADEAFELEFQIIGFARPVEVTTRRPRQFAEQAQVGVRADAEDIEPRARPGIIGFLKPFGDGFDARRCKRSVAVGDHHDGALFLCRHGARQLLGAVERGGQVGAA